MEKIGIYQIYEKYQVHGIIGKDGCEIYNPFNGQKVLPFWGTLCTTFSGLNEINQKYLEENCEKIGINNKIWKTVVAPVISLLKIKIIIFSPKYPIIIEEEILEECNENNTNVSCENKKCEDLFDL